jgi:hypothetical protein
MVPSETQASDLVDGSTRAFNPLGGRGPVWCHVVHGPVVAEEGNPDDVRFALPSTRGGPTVKSSERCRSWRTLTTLRCPSLRVRQSRKLGSCGHPRSAVGDARDSKRCRSVGGDVMHRMSGPARRLATVMT